MSYHLTQDYLRNRSNNRCIGPAFCSLDPPAASTVPSPPIIDVVKEDDFDAWEEEDIQMLALEGE